MGELPALFIRKIGIPNSIDTFGRFISSLNAFAVVLSLTGTNGQTSVAPIRGVQQLRVVISARSVFPPLESHFLNALHLQQCKVLLRL